HATNAQVVSAVGRDVLGDELLRRCAAWSLSTEHIARLEGVSTGYVRVTVGANGDAMFDITPDVAWDRIAVTDATLRTAARADAIIFGSLAQRSVANRSALDRLLAALPAGALRVFDANLRPPYDDLALVRELARKATLIKVNSTEAARLATGGADTPGSEEAHARALAGQTGCNTIVVTAGGRGAGLLRGGHWLWEPGRPVTVVDTVGAGDSFVASLVAHLLAGKFSDKEILAHACRLGEWVASRSGATPAYNFSLPL